tara:strand:- start:3132 stop:4322 length:1191 start_codon:yes stop_codon:yes gene_type:complete
MALNYGDYAKTYAGQGSRSSGEALGSGIGSLLSKIPNAQDKFTNFENTFFNEKFGGINGQWSMDADGGVDFQSMVTNADFDPTDPDSSIYTMTGFKPLDRNKDYRSYHQQATEKFSKRQIRKMGGIDPLRFGKKYDQLEMSQAMKIAQGLKQLKYTNPNEWDGGKIYDSLQKPENKAIWNLLSKHGLLASDPDLAEIQRDAEFGDWLPDWENYSENLFSSKVNTWPTKLMTLLGGAGLVYTANKWRLNGSPVSQSFVNNWIKGNKGRVWPALKGFGKTTALYAGVPMAAKGIVSGVTGSEKAGNVAQATSQVGLSGAFTLAQTLALKKGKAWLFRQVMKKVGRGQAVKFLMKAGLAGIGTGVSGGIGAAVGGAFLASDIVQLYKAMQEIAKDEGIK